MMYAGMIFSSNRDFMVPDSYSLPPRKARLCRLAGAMFLAWAALTGLGALSSGLYPGPRVQCGEDGCAASSRPSLLLDDDDRELIQASPAIERAFDAHARRPLVRAGVAGIMLIDLGPFAALLLAVGLALRRLGRGGDDALPRALFWLRRASQAAMLWAVTRPLADSLMESLLSGGGPEGAQWRISFDPGDIGVALSLGVAAYAAVWALEAGLRAQRDLADFV